MTARSWLCECGLRFPAEGRDDGRCLFCGIRADRERAQTSRVTVVASKSHPGEVYHVDMKADGSLTCSCRGFVFRGRCRHVEEAS